MKRWLPVIVILVGILVIVTGFMYDVMFAGIPYQDPTPELAVTYAFHAQIASIVRWIGVSLGMTGGVMMILGR